MFVFVFVPAEENQNIKETAHISSCTKQNSANGPCRRTTSWSSSSIVFHTETFMDIVTNHLLLLLNESQCDPLDTRLFISHILVYPFLRSSAHVFVYFRIGNRMIIILLSSAQSLSLVCTGKCLSPTTITPWFSPDFLHSTPMAMNGGEGTSLEVRSIRGESIVSLQRVSSRWESGSLRDHRLWPCSAFRASPTMLEGMTRTCSAIASRPRNPYPPSRHWHIWWKWWWVLGCYRCPWPSSTPACGLGNPSKNDLCCSWGLSWPS